MFDIDKLNIYWPKFQNSKITEEDQQAYERYKVLAEETDTEAVSVEDFMRVRGKFDLKINHKDPYNQLLELEKTILLHPRNAHHLLMPVVDDIIANSKTGTYGKVYKELMGREEDSPKLFSSLQPHENVKKSIIFVKGKFGVGIVALDITFNTVSQLDSLELNTHWYDTNDIDIHGNPTKKSTQLLFKGSEFSYELNSYLDSDNNIISEVLSQLITTQVDNVKNPVGIKLGINTQTLNVVGYLIKRGVGFDKIIKFIKQPLIIEYLEAQRINESLVNKTNGEELNKIVLIQNILKKNGYADGKLPVVYNTGWYMTDEMLDHNLKSNKIGNPDMNQDQLKMFAYFLEVISQSRALSFVMQDQNADTKGLKDLTAVTRMSQTFEEALKTDIVKEFGNKRNHNFLSPFTKARELYYQLYGNFYAFNHTVIKERLDTIKQMYSDLQRTGSKKEKVISTLDNDFLVYLVQNYVLNQADIHNTLFGMVEGQKSLPERVLEFKKANPNNLAMKAFYPLLKTRLDERTEKYMDNLRLFERDLTALDMNDLIESMRDIYDQDELLYQDMIKFIFFQTGLNNSPFNYNKIIPQGRIENRETTNPNEFFMYDIINEALNVVKRMSSEQASLELMDYIKLFETVNGSFLRTTKDINKLPFRSYPFSHAIYYQQGKPKLVFYAARSAEGKVIQSYVVPSNGSTYHKRYNKEAISTPITPVVEEAMKQLPNHNEANYNFPTTEGASIATDTYSKAELKEAEEIKKTCKGSKTIKQ